MVTGMVLRRRSLVERKVLALLRGADIPAQHNGTSRSSIAVTSAQARHFVALRRASIRYGLTVLPADSPWLGADELVLLSWLAGAQRVLGFDGQAPHDPTLVAVIMRCAALLDDMGLRLAAQTLYAARLRKAAGQVA